MMDFIGFGAAARHQTSPVVGSDKEETGETDVRAHQTLHQTSVATARLGWPSKSVPTGFLASLLVIEAT